MVQELPEFILIGRERLNAHKAKIRAIDKIPRAHAAKEAALDDAQDLAGVLLDAEAKLGGLLGAIPDFHSSGRGTMKRKTLPPGITKKDSHHAQTLAQNPQIIERVKDRARQERWIPTSKEVYREVKLREAGQDLAG